MNLVLIVTNNMINKRVHYPIEQIHPMALGIANDTQGDEIKTEMDYKNVQDERI